MTLEIERAIGSDWLSGGSSMSKSFGSAASTVGSGSGFLGGVGDMLSGGFEGIGGLLSEGGIGGAMGLLGGGAGMGIPMMNFGGNDKSSRATANNNTFNASPFRSNTSLLWIIGLGVLGYLFLKKKRK